MKKPPISETHSDAEHTVMLTVPYSARTAAKTRRVKGVNGHGQALITGCGQTNAISARARTAPPEAPISRRTPSGGRAAMGDGSPRERLAR